MKKRIAISAIFLLFLAACAPVFARDAIGFSLSVADATPRTIVLQPGESLLIVAATSEVVTPIPPTNTPQAQAQTPIAGLEPDANAPFCQDIGIEHDPTVWHPHWNAQAGCWWGHFHGDDPNSPEMVSIFGPIETPVFGGPQSSSMVEHLVKHRGDVVFTAYEGDPNWVNCHGAGNVTDAFRDSSINDCVVAYRMVLHADDAFPAFLFKVHGYKVEMKVCTQESDYTDCGIVRNKGQVYFGNFRVPFYTARDLRPAGMIQAYQDYSGFDFTIGADADDRALCDADGNCIVNDEPYVQMQYPLIRDDGTNSVDYLLANMSKSYIINQVFWSSGEIGPCDATIKMMDGTCRNNYIRWALTAFDAGSVPDESNLLASPLICLGQEHCKYDNSWKGVPEVGVYADPAWDMLDGVKDDHITGVLWVDRFQQPQADQTACVNEHLGSTLADDCFKMEFEHYPISPGAAAQQRTTGSPAQAYYLTEYNQYPVTHDGKVK